MTAHAQKTRLATRERFI